MIQLPFLNAQRNPLWVIWNKPLPVCRTHSTIPHMGIILQLLTADLFQLSNFLNHIVTT